MTPHDDGELTINDLFSEELSAQLNAMQKTLDHLSRPPKEIEIEELIRVAHSIKGAARLIHMEEIAELGDSLESFFKGVRQKEAVFSEKMVQTTYGAISLLRTFVDHKNNPGAWLAQEKDMLVNLLADIQSGEGNIKKDYSGSGFVAVADDHKDPLKSAVKRQISVFNDAFKKLEKSFADMDALDTLIKVCKEMRQHAEAHRQSVVKSLTLGLEGCFKAARSGQFTWTRSHFDLLLEAASYLNRYCNVAAEDMQEWFKKNKGGIESVISIIQALSQQSAPVEDKQTVDLSLLDLFFNELENYIKTLSDGLAMLELQAEPEAVLERLMRAAHSLKGAARTVGLESIVRLAHVMEDYLSALQKGTLKIASDSVDTLLAAVDLLGSFAAAGSAAAQDWLTAHNAAIDQEIEKILALTTAEKKSSLPEKKAEEQPLPPKAEPARRVRLQDRVLRVSSDNLNRLMGLAGESLVESRWLQMFGGSLARLKRQFAVLSARLDRLQDALSGSELGDKGRHCLSELRNQFFETRRTMVERFSDFEMFMRRHDSLSDRFYRSVLDSRMRPFADGVGAFPRLVRDLSRQLNKKVQLIIEGSSTPVDREILEKLEAPLTHLIRNAIDHGIGTPAERRAVGKPEDGMLLIEAMHKAGMLVITITDDGKGIDIDELREKVIAKKLVSPSMGEKLTDSELLDFIFLPGFSTAKAVTEVSGRGIGLNVVQSMVQEVGGSVKVSAIKGSGMRIILQLPLTLSVIRALLAEICGEVYAFPLGRIDQLLRVPLYSIEVVEHRQYIRHEGRNIGLIPAYQFLGLEPVDNNVDDLPVIVVSDSNAVYGIVVDRFVGEKELVVQDLDPLLGKVPDIYCGAFLEDGSPVLIIDVEDAVRSIDNLLSAAPVSPVAVQNSKTPRKARKKQVLVVDDSITVREVECRLLQNKGYHVDTAVNGMDGWNAMRVGNYDLVITDVDMPRMNGIELVKMIKADPRLKAVPVMIVSYKERKEDRELGLEAGANYYLTKSSFHDDTLLKAVRDLIGEAE